MAARPVGERRGALWPWLVMPLIVLAAFYALHGVHKRPGPLAPSYQGASEADPERR